MQQLSWKRYRYVNLKIKLNRIIRICTSTSTIFMEEILFVYLFLFHFSSFPPFGWWLRNKYAFIYRKFIHLFIFVIPNSSFPLLKSQQPICDSTASATAASPSRRLSSWSRRHTTQLRFQKRNEKPLRKADSSSSSHEFAMPRLRRVLILVDFTLHLKVFSLSMGNTQRRRMGFRYCCGFHTKWEILMDEAAYVKRLLVEESKIFHFR